MTPIPIYVSIEADRPEIFAIAASRRAAAERLGYDADALALLSAQDRVRTLAQALGVHVSLVTLVAQYPDSEMSEHDPVATLGVAMPIDNERSAVWRALASAPTPTLGIQPYLATPPPSTQLRLVPVPRPTPTQPVRAQSVAQRPDVVPIVVPGAATTLSAVSDVTLKQHADSVRLDIRLNGDYSADSKSVEDVGPSEVVRRLRAQPLVLDARAERFPNELLIGYELVVRTRDPSVVRKLVNLTRASYTGTRFTLLTAVANVVGDCHDSMAQAMSASVSQATQQAITAARAEQRTLRSLVLAATYPTGLGDACVADASLSPLDRATDEEIHMPDVSSVPIGASVKLVFRTTVPAH